MALNLGNLLGDYNGTAFSVAGHSEWGFIPDSWKLAIPATVVPPNDYNIGHSPLGDDANQQLFLKAQYGRIRAQCGSDEEALFIALLRYHVAIQGTLAAVIANRAVIEDEYSPIAPANGNWADAANDIPLIPNAGNIAKFMKRHGNTLVHMMIYVFLSRGHHWQAEYRELYGRLKSACFISANNGFTMPSDEFIFRLALHPFGVKPLFALTMAHQATGHMAAAMAIRFAPHAPIAGVAHITTLLATINAMTKEAWWGAFDAKFQPAIATIQAEANAISLAPISYHVAAKVLGAPARVMPSANGEAAFNALCQFAIGYIDHLGRRHPLSGQQAVTRKSGGPTGIADAFSRACDAFGKPGTNVPHMTAFLAQL
jgi:hypothetical protein